MSQVNIEKIKTTKIIEIAIVVVLAVLAIFLIFEARKVWKEYNYVGKSLETQGTISITGEGKVVSNPDIAKIQIGLNTDAKTVTEAQKQNTEKMNEIVDSIKKQGLADKDIQTSNYSIYPKYDWSDGKSLIVGYTVSQSLDLKIRDTKKVSDILQIVGEKGANQVGNLTFGIDDPENLKLEARDKAIVDAKKKAEELADQLDVKLGKVINYYMDSTGGNDRYLDYKVAPAMGISEGAVAPAIEQGENEIKVNVTIVYEIL
ncbi:MAG: SIMPL domain-containing protein [Patescibacteria group bacterium]